MQGAIAKVEAAIDGILAEYVTTYALLPVQRRGSEDGAVTWSSDNAVLVELTSRDRQSARVVVCEIGLLQPIRKQLRSRRVTIEYESRAGS
jgi:hypothetical protein